MPARRRGFSLSERRSRPPSPCSSRAGVSCVPARADRTRGKEQPADSRVSYRPLLRFVHLSSQRALEPVRQDGRVAEKHEPEPALLSSASGASVLGLVRETLAAARNASEVPPCRGSRSWRGGTCLAFVGGVLVSTAGGSCRIGCRRGECRAAGVLCVLLRRIAARRALLVRGGGDAVSRAGRALGRSARCVPQRSCATGIAAPRWRCWSGPRR